MSKYLSEKIRDLVAKRAEFRCEYCLIYERFSFLTFHIDHIISLKHGGSSDISNLAYACPVCNLNKGTDIATVIGPADQPIPFFNPRRDNWNEHFQIESSGLIIAKTKEGNATLKILDLNSPDSIIERKVLIEKKLIEVGEENP